MKKDKVYPLEDYRVSKGDRAKIKFEILFAKFHKIRIENYVICSQLAFSSFL